MKNELMIGNFIIGNYTDYGDVDDIEKQEICTVLSIDSVGVCEYPIWVEGESGSVEHYDSFEGIELNQDWLIKLGYAVQPWGWVKHGYPLIYFSGKKYWVNFANGLKIDLEFVHNLQNLEKLVKQ